ncbi:hypothetical protein OG782_20975 [Streptomyces sp. NBC_00876]|uniref:hypothetical protein n=1 Tax=Streptomyces sp. NBC_00876 TaxID=2975853 RepID=UPI0038661A10|nr:hypothetical protein OG782_20975 [Streptomyces sp. NBC_00876]
MHRTARSPSATKRSRLGRRATAALLGAVALAGLSSVTASPATAAEAPTGINWDHTWNGKGVRVYVEEHGDYISVCDTAANGHSAFVTVDDVDLNISHYKAKVTTGKGTCVTHKASQGGRYNLHEWSEIGLTFEGEGGRGSYAVNFVNDH